jgi:hypothetical protein
MQGSRAMTKRILLPWQLDPYAINLTNQTIQQIRVQLRWTRASFSRTAIQAAKKKGPALPAPFDDRATTFRTSR